MPLFKLFLNCLNVYVNAAFRLHYFKVCITEPYSSTAAESVVMEMEQRHDTARPLTVNSTSLMRQFSLISGVTKLPLQQNRRAKMKGADHRDGGNTAS